MITALHTQFRVIVALILRETRATFGTNQLGYLWAIFMPAAGTLVFVVIFMLIGRVAPFGSSLALFFASGLLILQFFNKLGSSLMTALEANRALLTYPPIKEPDVLFSRFLLISFTYLLIIITIIGSLIFISDIDTPVHLEETIAAFGAVALLGFGFGSTNAVLLTLWDSWRHIVTIAQRPLIFISGIFYVPSYMPPKAIAFLEWNPLLHGIEWFRNGYYGNYDSVILDRLYLLEVGLILTFIGLAGERLTRKKRQG